MTGGLSVFLEGLLAHGLHLGLVSPFLCVSVSSRSLTVKC